jgi:glycerate kinase
MKVVVAPDTFKESLGASEVAAALAEGVLASCADARVDLVPMADGGEGTVAAMVAATGGKFLHADTFGPLGEPIRARFGMLGGAGGAGLPGLLGLSGAMPALRGETEDVAEGGTAVIEMAAASGLTLVPAERRDPLRTTTFGTGKLILAALDAGAAEIIIGLGGSATCDGGAGCAQALGVKFRESGGADCVCGLAGGGLPSIDDIDMSARDPRLANVRIRIACDVTNPLTGPDGSAAVYGPQKGATPEAVERLDAALAHLAHVIRKKLNVDVEKMPGAGAAGGLAAGLVAFADAKIERGAPLIAEAVRLRQRLEAADLCITGEGRLDRSSRFGKTTVSVAEIAAKAGVPVICIPGQAGEDAPRELFAAVHTLVGDDVPPRLAIAQTAQLLKRRAAEAMTAFIARRLRG